MTLKEAKKLLKKEMVIAFHSTEPFEFDESGWIEHEMPSVFEAFRVLAKEGYYISISGHDYNMREKRLKKKYEENTKAPGSDENSIKGDLSGNESIEHCGEPIPGSPLSAVEGIKLKWKDNRNTSENPALEESASQFNDALLDEQAKKIAELTKENERLERVSKTTTDEFNELYYRMITKSDEIKALCKEIAKLNGIIHKKNLKIEELGKESSRHLDGKIKMFVENVDLEQMLKDKDAVLSDVAEELRLSKIREKNLTEVSQKYMKENEELREKVAEKTKPVEMVRKGSKEYCEYGIAAEKMIQKMAKDIVNDRPVSPKDYEQYRLWAKGYRFNPQLPERTDEEEKKLNTAKSTLDDLKKKAYEFFNAKACNLGLVGSKDGNGIIGQMIGVDIAEEGGDLSGVFVLFGKDFIDALKKVKDVWQE